MRTVLPVNGEDLDSHWGEAHDVVMTEVDYGGISPWEPHEIEQDRFHDEGPHGTHHARIVRFLTANEVDMVVTDCAGQSILNIIAKMGLRVITGQTSSARQVALRAAAPQS